jgi:diaminopimelate epimerase
MMLQHWSKLKKLRIWERGVGHTLASGSSACAVAAAAVKQGLSDQKVQIEMEGGSLQIEVTDEFRVFMTGPASEIRAFCRQTSSRLSVKSNNHEWY